MRGMLAGRAAWLTIMVCKDTMAALAFHAIPAWIPPSISTAAVMRRMHAAGPRAGHNHPLASQRRSLPSMLPSVLLARGLRPRARTMVSLSETHLQAPDGAQTKKMTLEKMLNTQGFGTRKVCKQLVKEGMVTVCGVEATDASQELQVWEGMPYTVDDDGWEYMEKVYVMLNKPSGYECTRKMKKSPTIFELLPYELQERNVQPVGRLDLDTTGLLILTDDGDLIHSLTSPKKGKKKVYVVECKHDLKEEDADSLLKGVILKDEPNEVVKALEAVKVSEKVIEITIGEGKYHQIKRMVAAVGNRVEGLHRRRVAGLELPDNLEPGEWVWLDPGLVKTKLIEANS